MSPNSAPLGSLGVTVLDCEHRTPPAQETGHPYIAIPDIVAGRVNLATSRRISDSDLSSWTRRTRPMDGDILVTRRGRVGDTAPIPAGVSCAIGQNLVLLRSDGSSIDQGYLRWATRGPQWRAEVDRLTNVGAVFSSLNVSGIPKLRIAVRPIAEQRAISDLLYALDDKIVANESQIGRLLSLADTLFQRARDAGTANFATFAELADIGGGGTPSTSVDAYWGGQLHWATPTDVAALAAPYLAATTRTITEAGLAACSSPLYPTGSILMTSRATIGAFAVAQMPTAVNQGFIVVNAKDPGLHWWLFHDMRSRVAEFLTFANGATFLELPRGRFKSIEVRLPAQRVVDDFDLAVRPLHALAITLVEENRHLAEARDELLPLLLSGKVRVRDAAKVVEGVA